MIHDEMRQQQEEAAARAEERRRLAAEARQREIDELFEAIEGSQTIPQLRDALRRVMLHVSKNP